MDLAPHVTNLSRALAAAGTAGGKEAEAFLERFAIPLESAIRLTLLEVVSQAAEEISADLPSGSVDVRLQGSNPGFTVTTTAEPTAHQAPAPQDSAPLPPLADEGPLARITVRMPEQLKQHVDEAAGREGVSANAWLVRAAAAAVQSARRAPLGRGPRVDQRHQGWIR
ncbi:hypothetical protein [Streptomyces malaysiense]|uniref:Histidine kinase n=1 Tax=Streptomyces malaysiense TaxID=1428626 RepID=A0A1J4Q7Z4_9ACTN|nr:hypothetical protein [Streptomyces malaysiense]OIK28200.1 hypothetical protein VT52_007540 [Streptomyces malaysiense]